MKSPFDHIALIYNPNSTGDAPATAEKLASDLGELHIKATLVPTKYARHAIKLAKDIALKHKQPLIISVSGDGGYNEVINGAMRAKAESPKANPIVAVAAAGNANDHRRVMRDDSSLIDLITQADIKPFDLLKLSVESGDDSLERYAHSYIGFGITPEVSVELHKHDLNPLKEIQIVMRAFMRYRPIAIEIEGQQKKLDSLIMANINEMAKVLKFSPQAKVQDGKFELIAFPHGHKLQLLSKLLIAAIRGLKNQPKLSKYEFRMVIDAPVQLDGETEKISAGSEVKVQSITHGINSIF